MFLDLIGAITKKERQNTSYWLKSQVKKGALRKHNKNGRHKTIFTKVTEAKEHTTRGSDNSTAAFLKTDNAKAPDPISRPTDEHTAEDLGHAVLEVISNLNREISVLREKIINRDTEIQT